MLMLDTISHPHRRVPVCRGLPGTDRGPPGGGGSRAGLGPSPVSVDAASLRIILVLRSLDRSALYLTRSPIFPTDKCKASLTAADKPPDHANHSVHSQLISPTGCLDSVWTCTRTRPNLSCPSEDLHVSGVPVKTRVPVPPSTLARSLPVPLPLALSTLSTGPVTRQQC